MAAMKRLVPLFLLAALSAKAATQRPSNPPPPIPTPRVISTENNASCDITTSPAATLLLPFFEVEADRPVNDATNTIFSIVNTSRLPQIARVTVWTDYGYPALWFNVFLTGFDVQSISMYDVVSSGSLPATATSVQPGTRSAANSANPKLVSLDGCKDIGASLPQAAVTALRNMLTTGAAVSSNECAVGSAHPNASG